MIAVSANVELLTPEPRSDSKLLRLRLCAIRYLTDDINSFEFRSTEGTSLPHFTAGSHVDLRLPNGLIRSYSLLNNSERDESYTIAVKHERAGRGGSSFLHTAVKVGDILEVSKPKNNFPLDETATTTILIAGGIGITPLYAMARRLAQITNAWTLHYACRGRAHAAFLDDLSDFGDHIRFYFDDELPPGTNPPALDICRIVESAPSNAHLYCCGPQEMLRIFEEATAARPRKYMHVEYFSSDLPPADSGGFEVVLHRSGRVVAIQEGQTILDALNEAGMDLPFSCKEGVCGSCETTVVEGIPDHRDLVLSQAEKASNKAMMICCSGSKTPRLVLDI